MGENLRLKSLELTCSCSPVEFTGETDKGEEIIIHIRSTFLARLSDKILFEEKIKHGAEDKDDVLIVEELCKKNGIIFPVGIKLIELYNSFFEEQEQFWPGSYLEDI